jgi:hypothetical protein
VGGFVGPESVRRAVGLFDTPFLGGFVALGCYALLALVVQSLVHVPPPTLEERSGQGRPLSMIIRQPVFIVAVLAGAVGYGLMNLLMTATPIAMDICQHPFGAVAIVIEWHVVGMYAPGFFTGSLIRRFGVLNVNPRPASASSRCARQWRCRGPRSRTSSWRSRSSASAGTSCTRAARRC